MIDLTTVKKMTDAELADLVATNPEYFDELERLVTMAGEEELRRTQIQFYAVANPMAFRAHLSTAREIAIGGGNRSSKTTTALAELVMRATGHISGAWHKVKEYEQHIGPLPADVPRGLIVDDNDEAHEAYRFSSVYPLQKITGPIRARIVCNSLTDTLEPVIFPKLRYDQFNGIGDPKDGRGHWGLIPYHCLVGHTWESAYNAKTRTIRVAFCTLCTILKHVGDPKERNAECRGCAAGMVFDLSGTGHCWPPRWANLSTIQCLSYDQDLTAFTGSSMHMVIHDELPPSDIYRENQLRTLDVNGQIITAFTPPDEAGVSRGDVSWFFDHVYEPGLLGLSKHPEIDTIVIHTEANTKLRPQDVAAIGSRLTDAQREVRLYGRFIHLSGVIFSAFTRVPCTWCFRCSRRILPVMPSQKDELAGDRRRCPQCQGDDLESYCHVIEPFEIPATWPVIHVHDPHPRKADVIGWFAVSPSDEVYQIGELEASGTAAEIKRAVFDWEKAHRVAPVKRLGDPNILVQTDDKQQRGQTLRSLYDKAGLRFDLATDDINVGIENVTGLLLPDPVTRRPRWFVFDTCKEAIKAATHWSWDEYTRVGDREPKEKPRDKWKDAMDLWRYLANDHPSFHGYKMGYAFQHRRKKR